MNIKVKINVEGKIFVQSTEMEEKFNVCIYNTKIKKLGNKRIITI